MKKLFLIAMASFLGMGAYAQTQYGSARELKCTEEAVSFSTNIRAGWRLYSPHIGYADMLKPALNFAPSNLYTSKNNIPDLPLPANFEKAFNPGAGYTPKHNLPLQKLTQSPFHVSEAIINRNYIIYNYSSFLPLANAGTITLN